jgi:Domain of unknown function (DUF6766)
VQNWQSEFLAVGCLVVLSMFLREKDSPESKRMSEAHAKTGRTPPAGRSWPVIGLPALLQAVAIVWSVRDRQRRSR